MSRPIYIFAGGATGGHLYPAIAVADELKRLQPDAQIVFACSHYDIDKRVLSSSPYACIPQPIRPLPKRVEMIPGFLGSLLSSWHLAKRILRDLQPRAVVGTGAFAAVPVTLCSAKAGIPTALINIDAVAGRANRHLARKVEVVFVQFERTGDTLPRSARVVKVGCPVRRELLQGNAEEARRVWELSPHRKTLLIMAGSLGARNINQAVAAIADDLDELADDWQVLHICGPGKRADLEGKVGKKIRHVIMEYCQWMALAYAVSDLVLARAGASTIGELAALSKPAVLRMAAIIVIGFAFIWLFSATGYLIATAIAIAPLLVVFGTRNAGKVAVLTIVGTAAYYIIFIRLMGIYNPPGWLINLEMLGLS